MTPRLQVVYLDPHFRDRFAELPRDAQREVLTLLGRIANTTPLLGKPCGFQHATGNLGDCRKIYFDIAPNVPPRFRLVYRVLPDEERPRTIEVITVGPKFTTDARGSRESIYVRVGDLLDRI